jgi:hypothetical protein
MDPVSKAQAADTSHNRRKLRGGHDPSIGRQWPKGVSGNPGGRRKKADITKIFEEIFDCKGDRDEIKDSIALTLKSGRMAGVLLLREAAERLEGKVVQPVDMEVTGSITLEKVLEAKKKAGK